MASLNNEEAATGTKKVVCVTGASGFIASWLVKLLLLRGYFVRGTVRDPNDSRKTEHLLKLEGAKERLSLIKANLLEEGSFESAVEGCDGVFHTASPVSLSAKDPQGELVEPAVKGTLNVLKLCAKSPSVKRVVLTSSMAAVVCNGKPLTSDVIIDETWFSDPDVCKQYSPEWSGYVLSKTLAEEAAWKFAKENNIDMVTINPAMVIGPLLQPTINASTYAILILLNGAKTFPNNAFGWVNVKDVANVHIQAFENPSANGRYCLAESVKHYSEIVNTLHQLYPTLQLPNKSRNFHLLGCGSCAFHEIEDENGQNEHEHEHEQGGNPRKIEDKHNTKKTQAKIEALEHETTGMNTNTKVRLNLEHKR